MNGYRYRRQVREWRLETGRLTNQGKSIEEIVKETGAPFAVVHCARFDLKRGARLLRRSGRSKPPGERQIGV